MPNSDDLASDWSISYDLASDWSISDDDVQTATPPVSHHHVSGQFHLPVKAESAEMTAGARFLQKKLGHRMPRIKIHRTFLFPKSIDGRTYSFRRRGADWGVGVTYFFCDLFLHIFSRDSLLI